MNPLRLCLLLLALLPACSPSPPPGHLLPAQAEPLPSASPSPPPSPSSSSRFTFHVSRTPSPSSRFPFHASRTPPPSTLTPCSPLAPHTLAELPEIISDPYLPPPPGREERHQGVDFSYYRRGERLSILGVEIQSILSGTVAASLAETFPYGNLVIVETPASDLPEEAAVWGLNPGESLYILYAHLGAPPEVKLGHAVDACDLLGVVGKSGNAGIPHLHIETRFGPPAQTFASMQFYDTRASAEAMANYTRWRTSWEFRHFNPMDLLTYRSQD